MIPNGPWCYGRIRGYSLIIDGGWAQVARTGLDFIKRFS